MSSLIGTVTLNTLDPSDPQLSDLEPLREALAGAHVVGVGEGAHFVEEFTLARARLVRYLVEECGFTTLALECGHAEAAAINPWLAGEGDDDGLPQLVGPLTVGVFGQLLRWLRDYNRSRPKPLQVNGVDLPNTLTLNSDLARVDAYLAGVDPSAAAVLKDILPSAGHITGSSAVISAPQWGALGTAEQDALTAGLARLFLRLQAMGPLYIEQSGIDAYTTARRHLSAAVHTDYQLRAMNALFAGGGAPCDPSLREHYMAASVEDLVATTVDARIIVIAHNNHIQKTTVVFDGELTALPMGYYLARNLGKGYRSIALTHTGRHVPEMAFPAEKSPVGFTLEDVGLPTPPDGSIEKALVNAGLGTSITLTDLHVSTSPFSHVRSQSAVMDTDLSRAFDVVLSSPAATRDNTVSF
ncbi:erythromycin esterase family protein [Actinoplanes friuliensis]|uniref:EreC n=1 Tax=Actinoplanes friuliensis DSM 7358 TaxID=1246995 RepID=U5W3X8_9ACTN|nr:erythromycin esterase family protein [Actinoplanes friuliensis]AGZ42685.1 EreC [Actinoplanes friuliensis DSM 7358]